DDADNEGEARRRAVARLGDADEVDGDLLLLEALLADVEFAEVPADYVVGGLYRIAPHRAVEPSHFPPGRAVRGGDLHQHQVAPDRLAVAVDDAQARNRADCRRLIQWVGGG